MSSLEVSSQIGSMMKKSRTMFARIHIDCLMSKHKLRTMIKCQVLYSVSTTQNLTFYLLN